MIDNLTITWLLAHSLITLWGVLYLHRAYLVRQSFQQAVLTERDPIKKAMLIDGLNEGGRHFMAASVVFAVHITYFILGLAAVTGVNTSESGRIILIAGSVMSAIPPYLISRQITESAADDDRRTGYLLAGVVLLVMTGLTIFTFHNRSVMLTAPFEYSAEEQPFKVLDSPLCPGDILHIEISGISEGRTYNVIVTGKLDRAERIEGAINRYIYPSLVFPVIGSGIQRESRFVFTDRRIPEELPPGVWVYSHAAGQDGSDIDFFITEPFEVLPATDPVCQETRP